MKLLYKANRHFFRCLFVFFIFMYSCKEPDNVGLEVLPESDLSSLNYSDTFSLQTSVVREDSIRTTANSANLLGAIHDNLFGDAIAGFYTQLLLSHAGVDYGSNPVCDSIILTLAYSGYYGDTTASHSFEVYRVNENISSDETYYSNKIFNTSDLLGTFTTADVRPHDSVLVNGIKTVPHLRIPLSNSIAPIFFFPSSSHVYDGSSQFLAYFNGIYVKDVSTPPIGGGSILYFNLPDTMSKITLYYDSLYSFTFNFPGVNQGGRINHFDHNDYAGAVFVNDFGKTEFGKNLCYIQSMGGVKTKIGFPFLNNLVQNGNISVNKAELIITIDNTSTGTYSAHSNLFLVGIDSAGNSFFLPDYSASLPSVFGGAQSNGTYTFLVTRYIQQILTGKRNDYGLYLVADGSAVNANRTVIGGSDNSGFPMKLKLSYTNINP